MSVLAFANFLRTTQAFDAWRSTSMTTLKKDAYVHAIIIGSGFTGFPPLPYHTGVNDGFR